MSEREMELAEYLKAMKPHHIRALVIQNGRYKHEREAFKTTIAALSSDLKILSKTLDQTQTRCTELILQNRNLSQEISLLRGTNANGAKQ